MSSSSGNKNFKDQRIHIIRWRSYYELYSTNA